jgi:PAS domain S-box-containing protein
VHEAIFVHDPEAGTILDVNLRACEMWGYSREELLELEVGDLSSNTPPHTQHEAFLWMTKAELENTPQVFEWLARHRTGLLFWTEINMRSIAIGENRFVLVTVRDISERKEGELKLKQAAANWDASFRAINDQICLLDREGIILQCNSAVSRSLNLPPEKVIGGQCYNLIHGTCTRIADCPRERTLKSRKRESVELQQEGRWFNITTDPVFDANGEVASVVHIIRDITDRKQATAEREALLKKLQAALTEIKTLHGLLPICANCKCIRDDEGYWIRIESYIESRSDAQFSHGICPECAKMLYPEHYSQGDDEESGLKN